MIVARQSLPLGAGWSRLWQWLEVELDVYDVPVVGQVLLAFQP
jgi:hypothetical protein